MIKNAHSVKDYIVTRGKYNNAMIHVADSEGRQLFIVWDYGVEEAAINAYWSGYAAGTGDGRVKLQEDLRNLINAAPLEP